jgi:nucleoside-diphosphate-sugar epimerase
VADVAATVWADRGRPEIVMGKQPAPGVVAERYVPNCSRARTDLGLAPATSLDDAIRRTMLAARARDP